MADEPYIYSVNPNNWGPGESNRVNSDKMHEVVDRTAMVRDTFSRNIRSYPGIEEEFPELHRLMVSIGYELHVLCCAAEDLMFALRRDEQEEK